MSYSVTRKRRATTKVVTATPPRSRSGRVQKRKPLKRPISSDFPPLSGTNPSSEEVNYTDSDFDFSDIGSGGSGSASSSSSPPPLEYQYYEFMRQGRKLVFHGRGVYVMPEFDEKRGKLSKSRYCHVTRANDDVYQCTCRAARGLGGSFGCLHVSFVMGEREKGRAAYQDLIRLSSPSSARRPTSGAVSTGAGSATTHSSPARRLFPYFQSAASSAVSTSSSPPPTTTASAFSSADSAFLRSGAVQSGAGSAPVPHFQSAASSAVSTSSSPPPTTTASAFLSADSTFSPTAPSSSTSTTEPDLLLPYVLNGEEIEPLVVVDNHPNHWCAWVLSVRPSVKNHAPALVHIRDTVMKPVCRTCGKTERKRCVHVQMANAYMASALGVPLPVKDKSDEDDEDGNDEEEDMDREAEQEKTIISKQKIPVPVWAQPKTHAFNVHFASTPRAYKTLPQDITEGTILHTALCQEGHYLRIRHNCQTPLHTSISPRSSSLSPAQPLT